MQRVVVDANVFLSTWPAPLPFFADAAIAAVAASKRYDATATGVSPAA